MAKFMREADGLDEEKDVYIPVKERRAAQQQLLTGRVARMGDTEDAPVASSGVYGGAGEGKGGDSGGLGEYAGQKRNKSLLEQAADIRALNAGRDTRVVAAEEQERQELALLKEAKQVSANALQSNLEIASGKSFDKRLVTTWTAPKYLLEQSAEVHDKLRAKWHIIVEGEDVPPPVKTFAEMKIPIAIQDMLKSKGILRPTPIQVQALPALFSGADIIGIAFTGSGKTLSFSLPMVMFALEEELNMPLIANEGPIGLVLAPSRELARQTFDVVEALCDALGRVGYPRLRSTLIIGGEDKRKQVEAAQTVGVHNIVATPGRLNDLLKQNKLNMDVCKYMVLDEGDRMLDLGFDEEVHSITNAFKRQRQTVLFSATMPQKFQDFARTTLVKPILVNVGRAGAANLDVIQEVEYVKKESKVVYLLECLQKTAPPVIIFCERKGDVDEIHEYLLVKGVDTASIHGGKDQEERNEAIALYKDGKKDVLVATDVAAKGLDFPCIQHVINFDMPSEIENYVHRIGRTGRSGKTGVATTFINKDVEESILLDLKHLLREAKQRIPPVLQALADPTEMVDAGPHKACPFCGGLGHRITECPKLDKDARRLGSQKKDALAGGDW